MLELFFRKYSWTVNLVALLGVAWFTARIVNTFVGMAIRPTPKVAFSSVGVPAARPAGPAAIHADKLYALIGQKPPADVSDSNISDPALAGAAASHSPSAPRNCGDPRALPTRTNSHVRLVAAVLAERAQDSLATLAGVSDHETQVVRVGDDFQGIRLLAVAEVKDDNDVTGNGYRVVGLVCNGGTKEFVEFGAAPEAPNLGVSPVPSPRNGVHAVGNNKYEIERATIDRTLSNLNNIATQARIVPSFKNGVANGFRLFSIQPNSLYSSIGIENGDVIQRINGYEINSPEKALELYSQLRDSPQVSIDIERGGTAIHKEYSVTP